MQVSIAYFMCISENRGKETKHCEMELNQNKKNEQARHEFEKM